jgi:hypothetical protein
MAASSAASAASPGLSATEPPEAGLSSSDADMERDFRQFIAYYNDFESYYKKSKYKGNEATSECFMTFGVTGAGKSTTIARLLSAMTLDEFCKALASGHGASGVYVKIFFCLYGHSLVQQGRAMRAKLTH